ncbi:glycosyltransferase family 4 protein, partial [Pseudomonadota bacterium]
MTSDLLDVHVDGIVYTEVPLGGIARMWTSIINRLPDHGCRVFLYLHHITLDETHFRPEIEIISYPRRHSLRPGRLFNPLTEKHYRGKLDAMWSRARTGVFHSTHFTTSAKLTIPQVITVHDLFHERLPHCFSEAQKHPFCERRRECVEAADAIICDSEATAEDVRLTYGPRPGNSRVVWAAVDPAFQPLAESEIKQAVQLDEHCPYILYVGTRYPYKNFSGLLAGYAAWPGNNRYQLLTVGPPPTPDELALLDALGIARQVKFSPALSDSDLRMAYNLASAVVMPSLSEGFGLPLWEAMACEVPVVSSKGGSLPEIGGDIPYYFDFGPPVNIARALEAAVAASRPSERLKWGRQRATERTWDDVTRDYVD